MGNDLKTGKVYLVGAGCGDPKLLTVKARELLAVCESVIYDSLVSEEMLQWTKPDCEKLYVGKRFGAHAMRQNEINELLIQKAREGKLVVRLKGGDPYVFGRGGEEFLALLEAGILCEEIPGISSAIAVPAAAGIPVTHRGLAGSVTVVTGTAAGEDGQPRLKLEFEILARLSGTLVILMGMHFLKEIAEGLIGAGKPSDTPCAVIMEGTTGNQRCLRTILSKMPGEAAAQGYTSPAVIVVGAVAKLELSSEADLPLAGVTVGVTGTPGFVERLSGALRRRGAGVWDMGFMEVRPMGKPLPDFADASWLVFTSPNGVRIFLDQMQRERRDLRSLRDKRIAVIGPGTGKVFEEAGVFPDYMPKEYDAVHLAEGLSEKILIERQAEGRLSKEAKPQAYGPAVFLRAREGSDALPRVFRQKGIPFLEAPLYELGVHKGKRAAALRREPDYIVFGSAMGVRAYFEGAAETQAVEEAVKVQTEKTEGMVQSGRRNSPRYLCIGEMCGKELAKYTNHPFLTAGESSIEGIVSCLCGDVMLRTDGN